MARFNIDMSDETKSRLFIRAQKSKKSMREYLLEAAGLMQYEVKKTNKN